MLLPSKFIMSSRKSLCKLIMGFTYSLSHSEAFNCIVINYM